MLLGGGDDLVVEVEAHLLLPSAAAGVLSEPLLEVLRQVRRAPPSKHLLRRPRLRVEMLTIFTPPLAYQDHIIFGTKTSISREYKSHIFFFFGKIIKIKGKYPVKTIE